MKLFSSNNNGQQIMWKSRVAAVIGLGLAVTAAACSGGASTVTSPSGVSPTSLASNPTCNGGTQNFAVTISPASVSVGSSTLTVTVTNALTSNCNQSLGSAQIVVPSGLSVTSVGNFVAPPSGKYWTTNWVSGQTVTVGAAAKPGGGPGSGAGLQSLDPGESVTFDLGVTSTICQTNTFANPHGSSNELAGFAPGWIYTGSELAVTVTGCALECDAAPSVANAYLNSIGFTGPGRGAIDSAVAQHMTQGAYFDGINPCNVQEYHDAVVAFVITRLPV